ncbi:YjcG family protein [Aquibacillus sp. 3ASR75-11]|uniref:Putative phosphoesterase NC797_13265 n=1 Tax=Terrihalobacillus insolitus TaxID=2950438 RepID=A0A9X4AMM2_9BACI|nr:YjcG family protein [Terrihalobacillus insolitus]MDC3413654.1 YjcG family protein [Terrihalobacillus insolitus]MDC3425471.1 YjcG family protein [Terrihalobacillus insolitus]
MKYGIAIFPSKKIQDEANSYRKRYDPHYALIPPHITLKESFQADDDSIHEIVTELRQIANQTNPFPLSIHKVSSFSPVTNTIYLKVEPVEELMHLNKRLHQGSKIPDTQTYAYIPHITIAQKLSDDEYSDVFGSLKMRDFNMEETVDRFQLLYQLENGSWTVYETFRFGKE